MASLYNQRGFTLIEVMIAVAVFSIGIVALYSMQINAIRGNSHASTITEISNIAREQIERLISEDFGNVITKTDTTTTAPIDSYDLTVTDWSSDGVDNDGDGDTDEFDERGVKNVKLEVKYTVQGLSGVSTVEFLKTEIF